MDLRQSQVRLKLVKEFVERICPERFQSFEVWGFLIYSYLSQL